MKKTLWFTLVFLFVFMFNSSSVHCAAPGTWKLADFEIGMAKDWNKSEWVKGGTQKGWRLSYQPGGLGNGKASMTIRMSAKPKKTGSSEEVYSTQLLILKVFKKKYPKGFAVQSMTLDGKKTLVLRMVNGKGTFFVVLPRTKDRLYEIYVWTRDDVRSMPQQAKILLAGLSIKPATAPAATRAAASPAPSATPVAPTPAPQPTVASKASPVKSACYVDADALEGVVSSLRMGMSLADVEAKYQVIPQTASTNNEAKYRVWKAQVPCLAHWRYSIVYGKGIQKEKTYTALSFDVDEKNPAKPVTRIVAKIKCDEGLEASKEIFGWYARTYGEPAQKVNKMDAISNYGSMKMPVLFWHIWQLQGQGGAPAKMILKLTRRNDFAYYTIDLGTGK